MYKILLLIFTIFFFSCFNDTEKENKAKYIFLFIGDGMGINQVEITNKYLKKQNKQSLVFSKFKNIALTSTNCLDREITDSGASGTAIACGEKTNFKRIGTDSSGNKKLKSIAEIAKLKDWKVGIISSVGLNHATPASFYGHQNHRDNYIELAEDLTNSNFDFFAGAGIIIDGSEVDKTKIIKDINLKKPIIENIKKANYEIIEGKINFKKINDFKEKKVFLTNDIYQIALPYAIDKTSETNSLAEFTKYGIDFLDNEKGFFMMVESGKIDWACHLNDAKTIVDEIIDFDKAIQEALKFYEKHPDETLIIVTADHETGGMSLGNSVKKYKINLKLLEKQKISVEYFKTKLDENLMKEDSLLQVYFDLKDIDTLYKKGGIDLIRNINIYSGIGWSTIKHTGTPVLTYAKGVGENLFLGKIENTDIKKIILRISEL